MTFSMFEVTEARNGKEGVDANLSNLAGVVLMDVELPVMN